MAVLKNVVLAASLLAPFTLAIPMMDKRAIYTHTETAIAWVTVEETTTVWVDPAQQTPPPEAAPAPVPASSSVPAAVFAATTDPPSTLATVVAPSSSAPEPVVAAASPPPAPVVPSQQSAPVASSSAAAVAPAAPVESSSVPVQPKDTASPDASCEGSGSACSGDVTHWDGGLGACGWNVDTASEMQIALPFAFMGTQSNGNPYCGRSVTLVNPTSGTTVQATVGDKCMGCTGRSIDCTDALFNAITDGKGDGRLSGIEWYFN